MSDEINIPTNLEEHYWIPEEETQPEEQQQKAFAKAETSFCKQ